MIKLILVLAIYGLFLYFINKAVRKRFNVKRKKFFSYGHVNEKHKKIDWTIRILFTVFLFIGISINTRDSLEHIWFLEVHIVLFIFIFTSEIARIIMEKKYAENRNDYIFTTIQLVIILLFLLVVFTTGFFGIVEP